MQIGEPKRIPETEHKIPFKLISRNAVNTIKRLKEAGFSAYLVGGSVRDLLLGMVPKDFDISTNATPEQTIKLFRKARIIGRRFRITHVYYGREVIEVTTFRGHHPEDDVSHPHAIRSETGQLLRDNIYGSLEDDAIRRDFTCNALYYDIEQKSVLDFTNGYEDVRGRVLRIIGDPAKRYQEDPVRMLRATRFAAKLDFSLEPETSGEISCQAELLNHIPAARLFDETTKLFLSGYGAACYRELKKYDLFCRLFPQTQQQLEQPFADQLITQALINTDQRLAGNKGVTPAFFFSVTLWPPFKATQAELREQGANDVAALYRASQKVISEQAKTTAIPRRFSIPMREIWELQKRLERRIPQRVIKVSQHPRFRAAYDFLLLREQCGEKDGDLGQWWTDYQAADQAGKNAMLDGLAPGLKKRRGRRKTRTRKPER